MANVILLAVALFAGVYLKRSGKLPTNAPATLNGYIIFVALPAAVIRYLHDIQFSADLILTALMPWLHFMLTWAVFAWLGRVFRFSRSTIGALVLVAGLGNTSFVGLPMIEAWFGKEFLGVGIIADQLGSFLILSTLGVFAASYYSSGAISAGAMCRKVLLFPPFQALCAAMLLKAVPFHPLAMTVLQKLADTIAPVALVSVGFQLRFSSAREMITPLFSGLAMKLAIAPFVIFALFVLCLGKSGSVISVTIFEAAMPSMITAGIVAAEHDLEPQLVALMIGIGIPLSFLTLALWHSVLIRFAQ